MITSFFYLPEARVKLIAVIYLIRSIFSGLDDFCSGFSDSTFRP